MDPEVEPPNSAGRRSRKRFAMRRAISQAGDRLFVKHGFDNVTVDDIAQAADVARMTVFNHFPRKEDIFFDRQEQVHEALRDALRKADSGVAPIDTVRLLIHRLITEHTPYLEFSARSQRFISIVTRSETLKARAREIRDELTRTLAISLAESAGRKSQEPDAHLAATLILATLTVAFLEAHQTFAQSKDARKANAMFLAIADQGMVGVKATMAHTPYARRTSRSSSRSTAASREPK